MVVKQHAVQGARIIEPLQSLREAVPLIRSHHERSDGGGYPDGLRGEDIPLAARIVACADAFDAMTSSRSYRPALPIDLALEIIAHEAGRQFDPEIATALLTTVQRWELELEAEAIAGAFDETLRRLRRADAAAHPRI